MRISRESRKLARELFRNVCAGGELSGEEATKVADLLVEAKPRGYYGALHEFTRLVRMELAKHRATIESAAPLDPSEQSHLEEVLRSRAGSSLTTEFRVKPTLLGGLRIQLGSDVLDGSVQARIEQLKTTI